MEKESYYRYIGNFLLLVGYFILLWADPVTGLATKCIGGLLSFPFMIKNKLWDVVIICTFFFILDITKIVQLVFFKS